MKRQWGQNLMKFQGVKMPGGMELNGRQIWEDGTAELEKLESRMNMDYELPPLDFIGLMKTYKEFSEGLRKVGDPVSARGMIDDIKIIDDTETNPLKNN